MILVSRLSGGGAERAAAEISRYLARQHEVSVLSVHDEIAYPYGGKLINLQQLHRPKAGFKEKLTRGYRRLRRLYSILKREQPDIVLSYMDNLNITALAMKMAGIKARFVTSTQIPTSRMYKGMYRLIYGNLIKSLYPKADQVLALSKGIRSDLNEHFGVPESKIQVIYNPVDNADIAVAAAAPVPESWFSEGVPVIVHAGRLVEQKNQVMLFEAFQKVRKEMPCKLVLIGKGRLEEMLKNKVMELGIEKDVYFAGWRDNPFAYFQKANVFALSSDFEGFGNVIVEAMAANCPVVSTDCEFGPREIIGDDEFGLLTPVGNSALFAQALLKILKDPALSTHYRKMGLQRAKDFDLDVIGKEYEDLFFSLTTSGKKTLA